MIIYAFEPVGFEGELVTVEVDLRRGIPSVDLVGLADGAVKEARERMRAAIRNSGFEFPLDRLLINLAPAGVRKAGASFDLAMALAVLTASGQIPDIGSPVLALGELELSGRVRPVSGVLSAVAAGLKAGVSRFIVPRANLVEARVLAGGLAVFMEELADAARLAAILRDGYLPDGEYDRPGELRFPHAGAPVLVEALPEGGMHEDEAPAEADDMADIRGQGGVRRAMEVAAAGGHHMLFFGPPGAGKSMAARRLAGLLPDLDDETAVTVTMLHSLAGALPELSGLIRRPPFRSPHHGASAEGVVGGGRSKKPGEISLAHGGVLLLDESPEFRSDVLQSLREPLEEGCISIVRADRVVEYPSRFMLILSCNPCPCGNLGRRGSVCLCSPDEIRRYWKRLGGPLLDRIDIRMPFEPASPMDLAQGPGESTSKVKSRVGRARSIQAARYAGTSHKLNGELSASGIDRYCRLDGASLTSFVAKADKAAFSSRACHSILRLARTIADLGESETIEESHVDEAFDLRRYGDSDVFWILP